MGPAGLGWAVGPAPEGADVLPAPPPDYVAFLRAHAYGQLGRVSVALAFIRFARQLAPADVDVRVVEYILTARAGPPGPAAALAWQHVEAGTPARLVVVAAGHLFRDTRGQQTDVARPTWQRLAEALRRAIDSDELRADDDADEVMPYAHRLLGGCLDGLGDPAARAAYAIVLATRPRSPGRVAFQVTLGDYVRRRFDAPTPTASRTADMTRFDLASTFHPRLAA